MSNNKQSSVEWFAEKTFNLIELMKRRWVGQEEFLDGMLKLRDEAKAMHKEEIMDAHLEGQCDETEGYPLEIAKKYYNETFNTKEK